VIYVQEYVSKTDAPDVQRRVTLAPGEKAEHRLEGWKNVSKITFSTD
jgi:hypothetical protein